MKKLQFIGAIFTIILGTLLHFTYDWSGKNIIVGIFSAVNESTWEHLKLLAIPILLFAIIEYFLYGNQVQNFVPVKVISVLLGMGTIVIAFYTYVGIVGQHFLLADISTFIIGVVVAYRFSAKYLNTQKFSSNLAVRLGWIFLVIIYTCIVLFTFFPPNIGLFIDPVSGHNN